MDDPRVTEIMVNGPDQVFVETGERSGGGKSLSNPGTAGRSDPADRQQCEQDRQYINAACKCQIVRRIESPCGPRTDRIKRTDLDDPEISGAGDDGTAHGIRKHLKRGSGSLEDACCGALQHLCQRRHRSGKTTLLNALSEFIPSGERVITIEDAAELQLSHIENLVRLETRDANAEGAGAIGIGELIRAALRMRPDRIIVGEVRGKEALDLLQSLNTGHDGGFSSGHANSVKDMLARLETMVLMAADLPLSAIRSQIASAVDVMVHVARMRDKTRKITAIEEVDRFENGEIILNPLSLSGRQSARRAGSGTGGKWKEALNGSEHSNTGKSPTCRV